MTRTGISLLIKNIGRFSMLNRKINYVPYRIGFTLAFNAVHKLSRAAIEDIMKANKSVEARLYGHEFVATLPSGMLMVTVRSYTNRPDQRTILRLNTFAADQGNNEHLILEKQLKKELAEWIDPVLTQYERDTIVITSAAQPIEEMMI